METTYTEPLSTSHDGVSDQVITAFASSFDAEVKTEDITSTLESEADVKALFESLVPEIVSYADFWSRYFFRCDVESIKARLEEMEREQERRREELDARIANAATAARDGLLGGVRAITDAVKGVDIKGMAGATGPEVGGDEEEVGWGDDDDERVAELEDEVAKLKAEKEVALKSQQMEIEVLKEKLAESGVGEEKVAGIEAELTKVKAEAAEAGAANTKTIAELKVKLEESERSSSEEVAKLREQLATAESGSGGDEGLAEALRLARLDQQKMGDELKEAHEQLKTAKAESERVKVTGQEEVQGLREEIEALQAKLDLSSVSLADNKSVIEAANAKHSEAIEMLEKSKATEAERLLAEKAKVVAEKDGKIEELEGKVMSSAAENGNLKAQMEQLKSEIVSLKEAAASAPADSPDATAEIELWKQRAQKCRDDRTMVVNQKKEMQAKLEEQIKGLEDQLKETVEASKVVNSALATSKLTVNELTSKVKELEEKIAHAHVDTASQASGESGVMVSSSDISLNKRSSETGDGVGENYQDDGDGDGDDDDDDAWGDDDGAWGD